MTTRGSKGLFLRTACSVRTQHGADARYGQAELNFFRDSSDLTIYFLPEDDPHFYRPKQILFLDVIAWSRFCFPSCARSLLLFLEVTLAP